MGVSTSIVWCCLDLTLSIQLELLGGKIYGDIHGAQILSTLCSLTVYSTVYVVYLADIKFYELECNANW